MAAEGAPTTEVQVLERCILCEQLYQCHPKSSVLLKMCLPCRVYAHLYDDKTCWCDICGDYFKTSVGLLKHIFLHEAEGSMWQCKKCQRFYFRSDKKASVHKYRDVQCSKCSHGSTEKLHYFEYDSLSDDGEVYACGSCNARYSLHEMVGHVLRHLKENAYGCVICDKKTYDDPGSFEWHFREHFKLRIERPRSLAENEQQGDK